MQLVAKNVTNKLIKAKIQLLSIKCSTNGEGVIMLHDKDDIEDLLDMNVSIVMCVYNGARVFNCKEDTEKGSAVIYDAIAK